jgi:hypothetical protein
MEKNFTLVRENDKDWYVPLETKTVCTWYKIASHYPFGVDISRKASQRGMGKATLPPRMGNLEELARLYDAAVAMDD